jgi:hypothetical protein
MSRLSRLSVPALFPHLLTCALLFPFNADAAEASALWNDTEAQAFCAALPAVDDTRLTQILGEYSAVLRSKAPAALANLRLLDFAATDAMLQKAMAHGWGILDMLTDAHNLPDGACSLIMDGETLQQVDAVYNLHGLWMINAPLDNDVTLPMSYILFGAGTLVIGYPRGAVIKVTDYDFSGGRYAYTPFVMADIVNSAQMRGLENIQVLESPQGKTGSFKGPRASSMRNMRLHDGMVSVSYSVFGITSDKTITNLKIEKR